MTAASPVVMIGTVAMEQLVSLCERSYPRHNLEGHLLPVVRIAEMLAKRHGADEGIVVPGAYLHDIGRVKFDYLKVIGINHDLSGYHYSRFFLKRIGVSPELAESISRTVLTHSGDCAHAPSNIEEEIVMNADAVSHFTEYLYLLSIRYSNNGLNLRAAKDWVLKKLEKSYTTKLTLPGVTEFVEDFYDRAKKELSPDSGFVLLSDRI
ncbi:HD domain-containing protein [Candidatus Woesearchaeota archaeon]|nr:HD domain-containing protein [Candidatus Woesearchaeota archaeon]